MGLPFECLSANELLNGSNVAVLVQCDHELLPFVLSVLSIQKIFSVDF